MLWLMLPAVAAQPPSRVTGRWWHDPAIERDLELTAAQARRLDAIFESDLPARIALHQKIRRMDAELLRIIRDEDEERVLRFVDDLQVLRRKQNVRRALMLVEMYKVLTPPQRARLMARSKSDSGQPGH
jgi:Spy/CpxP family protein refolding chaperone